ncbi:MAG: glycosyl transferase family protein [Pseudomonadota bacterium]
MSLSEHVRTLGRGPGRSRSLTEDEAYDAMREMLSGQAAPEAIGALLMLLRMKGETAEEIAGLANAAQGTSGQMPAVDLDWPSYAAGRTRGPAWFLLSAKLVARAGHRVLLHGWNGPDPKVRDGLASAGIRRAGSVDEAERILDQDGVAYFALEDLHPALFGLLQLRDVLGLRSCVNTVCRMLNPGRAKASVQGVFHPSYRRLQADAAALLGWSNLSVIKGGGGEFERTPAKNVNSFGLRSGMPWDGHFAANLGSGMRLSETTALGLPAVLAHSDVYRFEREIIVGTASLALDTLGHLKARETATRLWAEYVRPHAA